MISLFFEENLIWLTMEIIVLEVSEVIFLLFGDYLFLLTLEL